MTTTITSAAESSAGFVLRRRCVRNETANAIAAVQLQGHGKQQVLPYMRIVVDQDT